MGTQKSFNISAVVEKSENLTHWIDSKVDGFEVPSILRFRLSAGCIDQALEHQKSIILLVRYKHFGSALALVRLIFESYVRGVWIHQCASDAEVEMFAKDKLKKSFPELLREIEKQDGFDDGILSSIHLRSWDAMNSFTHTGYKQSVRRNTETSIEPNYSEEEILETLNFANALVIPPYLA